jgi:dUTP pyrophosphatase
MVIKVKYFKNREGLTVEPLNKIDKGDWIDVRTNETIALRKGDFVLIPLGIGMKLPEGYEAHLVPRSSTFKNWGIIQTNSIGVIDNSYSGDNDQWMMPVYATRDAVISRNERIAQFRIVEKQPMIGFDTVEHLDDIDRGGFGSTGVN